MTNIFVADPISDEGLKILKDNNGFVVTKKTGLKGDDLINCLKDAECLLVRSETHVTADVIEAANKLKLIGRAGVGVDNIDREKATSKGIVVMNVPGGNTISAAEHTMGLMLALARNIPQANTSLKAKQWERKKFVGVELVDKTLGLIGLGRIGREVCRRALAFGMRVISYDPFASEEYARNIGITLTDLDTLYREADYISLHVPKNEQTLGMINKGAFSKMKKGVRIVNCARGGIINEADLLQALDEGIVAGAALDVFSKEPAVDLPVIAHERIVVTPHLAASTEEAQVKVAHELSKAVIDYFKKGIMRNTVNMPAIDPEVYRVIEPYIKLSEKMGKFLAQTLKGGIVELMIEVNGEITQYNVSPLTVAACTGVLNSILDIDVNMVNASLLAKERGIRLKEVKSEVSESYTSLIKLTLKTDKGKSSISGTLLSHAYPRIVSLNGLDMDIIPSGKMLVVENMDQPGVIGRLGTVLGKNNINIAEMHVGRYADNKQATTVVHVDNPVSSKILKEIEDVTGVKSVHWVEL